MTEPEITEPDIYPDLTNEQYHADPVKGGSLSSSGARKLIPPSCPALFFHERANPQPYKAAFDFGHAAHRAVLTEGEIIEEIDAKDWRTNDAKAQRDAARAAGRIPLLTKDAKIVEEMAAALRAHPIASMVFAPGTGTPEQSLVWRDEQTGVMCRARIDWLPNKADGRRLIISDYKTARTVEPRALARAFYDHGYHQQEDWYLDGVRSLGLDDDPQFVFICQEKTAPYLVTVADLSDDAKRVGRARNKWARETYAQCVESGEWPPFSADIELIDLPAWAKTDQGMTE